MPSFEAASPPSPRLLLVSNRLPVAIKRAGPNDYTFTPGSGGLVSGLAGLSKSTEFQWYGWPGLEVPIDETDDLSDRLRDECGVVPVYLDDALGDLYYNGFASELIVRRKSPKLIFIPKTPSYGLCSIIILVKSYSAKMLGRRIRRQTACLPRSSLEMFRMVISSGSTITI